MLLRLQIENYALMERAAIEFGAGLNVLTGETGSGKSIVVDALGLLLGERADPGAVRSGADRAVVVGTFSLGTRQRRALAELFEASGLSEPVEDLIVRREVAGSTASGTRNRVFINHEPATVALLRQLAPWLGDIHSQHESLVAFTPAEQLRLLDRSARETTALLGIVGERYESWRSAREDWQRLAGEEQKRLQEADLWRFQSEELSGAQLRAGEDEELGQERSRLLHAERIAADAASAYNLLYDAPEAAVSALKQAARHAQDLSRFDAQAAELVTRLEAARSEVEDVAAHLRRWLDGFEVSPERLEAVEQRLAYLDKLKRKYGPTLAEMLAYREDVASRLERLAHSDELLGEARAREETARSEYRQSAERLSVARRKAAERLARAIEKEVAELAMKVRIDVHLESLAEEEAGWSARGWDRVQILASTNPGEPAGPLQAIASGGELSRILLALQVVIEVGGSPAGEAEGKTLVFDEVDAGIGGRTAEVVGRKLQQLASTYQLLCVTHLAQIATFATHHLRVEKQTRKGRTSTEITALEASDRVEEVARMLSGDTLHETSLRHAEELLAAHRTGGDRPAGANKR